MKNCLLVIGIILFTSSCQKECDYWMEGKKCKDEVRKKYLGTYVGTATIGGNTINSYGVVKVSNAGEKYFIIDDQIDCMLLTSTTFVIPQQLYYNSNGTFTVEGNGSFNGSQLIYNALMSSGGSTPALLNFTGSK